MNKKIIVFPLVLIVMTMVVYAGFLSTTVRFNPSGWEDNGSTIRTLTNNTVIISGDTELQNVSIGGGFDNGGIDLTTLGDISLNGDILIRGDILTITDQEINGSFLPTLDNKFDLGTVNKRWKDIYVSGTIFGALWNKSGTNLFPSDITNNVGIGTITPTQTLTVIGTANITGNTSIGTNVLFVDNTSGRVGIGTTSPNAALEVVGDIRFNGRNLIDSSASNMDVLLSGTTTTRNFRFRTTSTESLLNYHGLLKIGSGTSTHQIILNNGNIGFGTTNPTSRLTVVGAINISSDIVFSTNNVFLKGQKTGLTTENIIGIDSSNDLVIGSTSMNDVSISVSSIGGVGIRDSDPDAYLEVVKINSQLL